jgi:hypothetical protein
VFTNSPFVMVQAEGQHRDHVIVEQVFADWNAGPLAHMPSAMSQNLVRAAGVLAGPLLAKARTATIRRYIITVPARSRGLTSPDRSVPHARQAQPAPVPDPKHGQAAKRCAADTSCSHPPAETRRRGETHYRKWSVDPG